MDEGEPTLQRLLAMALRLLVDELHGELEAAGHTLRPAQGFALVAVGDDGTTTSDLAAVLGITKQGTAKLVDSLVELGYLDRRPHQGDGRARLVVLTPQGRGVLEESVRIQGGIEERWGARLGVENLQQLRTSLARAVTAAHAGGYPPVRPVW